MKGDHSRLWCYTLDPKKTHGSILIANINSLFESRRTKQRLHFVEVLELNNYDPRSRGAPSTEMVLPPRTRNLPPASISSFPMTGRNSLENASSLATVTSAIWKAGGLAWACRV